MRCPAHKKQKLFLADRYDGRIGSLENGGIAVGSLPTLSSPIWFYAIIVTVSGLSTRLPLRLPLLSSMRMKAT